MPHKHTQYCTVTRAPSQGNTIGNIMLITIPILITKIYMLRPCYGFHNLTTNGQFGLVKILNMELGNENSAEISIFVSYLKFTNLQNSIKSHHNFESNTVCLLSHGSTASQI